MLNKTLTTLGKWIMTALAPLMLAQQHRADQYLKIWKLRWDEEKQTFY